MPKAANSNFADREVHYIKHFGVPAQTFPGEEGKDGDVIVSAFAPVPRRNFWTLATNGMSDRRQHLPAGTPGFLCDRTEILMYADEPAGWMVNVMKGLAELAVSDDLTIHWWNCVPNGMPMTAGPSLLTHFLFLPPFGESVGFDSLELEGNRVQFLFLVPITDAEAELVKTRGAHALLEVFERTGYGGVTNETRKSLV